MNEVTCNIPGCTRRSCRPAEYEPLCSRHYVASLKADDVARGTRRRARAST